MINFRTKVEIPESENKINHQCKLLFIGSCFTDSIGNCLANFKLPVDINPFGVLYNPASISESIRILINKKTFTESDLSYTNEQWFSFYHHSDFAHWDKNSCLEKINSRISSSHEFLKSSNILFITLGTAWIYRLRETGRIVSNCHKLPAREFIQERLSTDQIVEILGESLKALKLFNPHLKIVFTISPIRHWKDGAHGNQLSKSTLLLAVEKLIQNNPEISYFPSYEIVMDELRDYRFYDSDMLHICPVAVDYIFERFAQTYFTEETLQLNKAIEKIVKAAKHKPFNPNSNSHKKFRENNLKAIEALQKKYPGLDFGEELGCFKNE